MDKNTVMDLNAKDLVIMDLVQMDMLVRQEWGLLYDAWADGEWFPEMLYQSRDILRDADLILNGADIYMNEVVNRGLLGSSVIDHVNELNDSVDLLREQVYRMHYDSWNADDLGFEGLAQDVFMPELCELLDDIEMTASCSYAAERDPSYYVGQLRRYDILIHGAADWLRRAKSCGWMLDAARGVLQDICHHYNIIFDNVQLAFLVSMHGLKRLAED